MFVVGGRPRQRVLHEDVDSRGHVGRGCLPVKVVAVAGGLRIHLKVYFLVLPYGFMSTWKLCKLIKLKQILTD